MAFQRRVLNPEEMRGLVGGRVERGSVVLKPLKSEQFKYGNRVFEFTPKAYVDVSGVEDTLAGENRAGIKEGVYIVYDDDTQAPVAFADTLNEAEQYDVLYHTEGSRYYKRKPDLTVGYGPGKWETIKRIGR